MTDPSFTPPSERELLVVYPTRQRAEAVRAHLLHLGISPAAVQVDEEADEIASLRAEMREELSQAWIVPNAGLVATKESVRGMVAVGAIATLASLAVAIPLAFVDFVATLGVRLVWFSVIAIALGGTVGFVAGGAASAKRPAELMAAQRGTVLRVSDDSPALRRVLLETEPIRLDEVGHDDRPIETVMTEDDADDRGTFDEIAANAHGDDYHPTAHPERSATTGGHASPRRRTETVGITAARQKEGADDGRPERGLRGLRQPVRQEL